MNTKQMVAHSLLYLSVLFGLTLFAAPAAAQPPSFVDLGTIASSVSFTFDTIGSGFDTEIGLWDSSGNLLDDDDDGGPGVESSLDASLPDGVYFIAISEFDSTFQDGFVNSGDSFEAGEIETGVLNINGAFAGSILIGEDSELDETGFFRFEVVTLTPLIDLGIIGPSGSFTFDTIGSGFDTEIGLWDALGNLLDDDDDGGATFDEYEQSSLESLLTASLPDGVYFIAISEFDSIFQDGFVNIGDAFEAGGVGTGVLNIDGALAGSITIGEGAGFDETGFFRFEVRTPATPPAEFIDLGIVGTAGNQQFSASAFFTSYVSELEPPFVVDVQTALALFDSIGTLVQQEDSFFPTINVDLPGGEYFLAVGPAGTNFDNGFVVEPGNEILFVEEVAVIANDELFFDSFISLDEVGFLRVEIDSVLKGDVNLDGRIDFDDIPPFILVLQAGGFQAEADCDCSTVVDFDDISAFIDILMRQ